MDPTALPAYFDSFEKTEGVIRDNAASRLREATGSKCECVLLETSSGTDDPTTVGCPSMDGLLVSQSAGAGFIAGDIYATGFAVWRCLSGINTYAVTVDTFCLDPRSSDSWEEVIIREGWSSDLILSE
ncbi:hypothetical protein COW94_01420 [Candidatus Peregrinibacteria bacterium CG22_combo_CG10-13_8_21_14_all_44_10]|nr:MAG: hypothetical protein AUK45_00615 [Candidatus Peregrinibacteria bacterium CG2_30_44_17]PIP66492.1 MAG: hypothetical protein COW94_01420 [Candidatus Peregrinibacteria bacterium CG22_combo_CG10-13_8_21_14_all_44_10]PIS04305.1 MAG: hypothetical protein COT83_01335 [Candidatus Peregrinibacteria bacterium CG10_big_fil_rev_8_21_14_0_10_44_7]PIX80280.1 MAG: hypothetical protein COZ35_01190 [Candidatus Peregrinibacteria bacterium CG_4_10_14_3_um_filter_44_21]PJB89166.1 MAG: hypothetical protein 